MLNFSNLKNRPILAKDNLCIIGKLTDCIFSENLNNIAYFLCINDEGDFLISPDHFTAINDALVVEDCVGIKHLEDVDFTALKTVLNKEVYTADGLRIGETCDITFDQSGKVGQIILDNGTMKTSDVVGVGEIVLLKAAKKRKKAKPVNLTSLAVEDKPVSILEGNNTTKMPKDMTYAIESAPVPVVATAPKVTVANATTEPPRIISDYNFLLGRKLTANLYTFSGDLIAHKDTLVTVSVVDKARLNGKLLELTYNSHFGE